MRSQLSVSLFPFLAVLICTLGVLIVMLVMAVKSADDQANQVQADDDAEKQSEVDRLQGEVDLRQIQIRGAQSVRPDELERMRRSRDNRSYLEEEIRKIKREFESVGQQLIELDRQANQSPKEVPAFSETGSQAIVDDLKLRLAKSKSALEEKRDAVGDASPTTYVIVPHKGGGGTFRRPIYLECTKDAITLQPSGIRLNKNEFVPPIFAGNMLDAALLANREYWNRYDLAGKEGDPYPLLVVRPDGAETFVLARRAMKSWDDEFGYELVDDDKTLDFGQADSQLADELRQVIELARRRQRAIAAAAKVKRTRDAQLASYNSSPARPGLTASGRYGGFVSTAGSGSGNGISSREADARQSLDAQESERESSSTSGQSQKSSSLSNESEIANSENGDGGDITIRNPSADASLAKDRGSNWALPSQTPGATGYLRPVRIICGPNSLELKTVGGKSKRIAITGSTAEAVDPLVDEIWKKIDAWGISGANSYWKPQLRVSILPGGEARFSELKGLLYQSGLLVEKFQP